MKSKITLALVSVAILTLAGCGGSKSAKFNTISDLGGKTIGMVATAPDVKGMDRIAAYYLESEPGDVVLFNRTSDLLTALLSGKIDAAMRPKFVAEFYAKRNSNLRLIPPSKNSGGIIFMALRSEDLGLRDSLNTAITTLQENGRLAAIEDQWITNLPASNEPSNQEVAKIDGAKTVYVGIAGDFTPLDYIAANGRPAGYNIELLSEIGKMLKINFEFVSIETQARFLALSSKKIDVIFCNVQNQVSELSLKLENNSWISTKPYYTFTGGYFIVKK
jgi:ABC-type amino acid transport substrate-binding protein